MIKTVKLAVFFLLCLGFGLVQPAKAFLHPGIPLTIADLNQLKTNLTIEPWKSGYNALVADSHSQLSYVMQGPFGSVSRTPNVNLGQYGNDMQAVYNLARMWYFTSNSAYAQKGHDIMIAWATTHTNWGGAESYLTMGDYAYRMYGGADILRGTWPGWTQADTDTCKNYFNNVYGWAATAPNPLRSANQGVEQLITGVGIAAFNDDTNKFNQCLQSFRADACGGLADTLPNGELGDSGRDQGHAYGEMMHLAWIAEVFWKQGVDVYSELDTRLLAAGELYSRYSLGVPTAYVPFGTKYDYYWQGFGSPPNGSAQPPDGLNLIHGAYVIRKGMSAPYLAQYRATQAETSDTFVFRKIADSSTATPPAPLTLPAATMAATTGFLDADIGGATPAGSSTYNNGIWTVTGAGSDITDSSDSFHFTYKQVTGDFTMIARVTSLQSTNVNAKAAFEVRDSLAGTPARRVYFGYVPGSSAPLVETKLTGYTADSHNDPDEFTHDGPTNMLPHWLKMQRIGSRITIFHSADAGSWTPLQNAEYAGWTNTAYIGMGVCSHNNGTLTTATFTDVRITGGDGGEAAKSPLAPSNIYGSPGNAQIPLRWLESYRAASYILKRSTTNGGPYITIAGGLTNTSYVDTGLTNGATYYYVVSATNSVGGSSNSPQEMVTLPSLVPPSKLTAMPGNGLVSLSWPPSAGATAYQVMRGTSNGGPYFTIAPRVAAMSYTDTGLTNGTIYYYVVAGVFSTGAGANSAQAWATPTAGAAVITRGNLIATLHPSDLQNNPSPNVWVNRSSNTNSLGDFMRTSLINILTTNLSYSGSKVAALNVNNTTANALQSELLVPSQITNNGTVSVDAWVWAYNWHFSSYAQALVGYGNNNVNNADRMFQFDFWNSAWRAFAGQFNDVQYVSNDVSGVSLTLTNWHHVAWTYNGTNRLFTAYLDGVSNTSKTMNSMITPQTLLGVGATCHSTTLANPLNGAIGAVRVQDGLWSLSDVTNNFSAGLLATVLASNVAPSVPTGLTAAPGDAEVDLTWNNINVTAGYNVKRATAVGGSYTLIASNLDTVAFTDSSVTNGVTYYYKVAATNSLGFSADSTAVSATPVSALQPPQTPGGFGATAGEGQVILLWNAASDATGYNVKRAATSGGAYFVVGSNVPGLMFTNAALVNGTLYYFVVSGTNVAGESGNSAEVSVRPVSLTPPTIGSMLSSGQLQFTWPMGNTGWHLESQTSDIASGLGTNWVTIFSSTGTNQISIPISTTEGSVFFRLRYP